MLHFHWSRTFTITQLKRFRVGIMMMMKAAAFSIRLFLFFLKFKFTIHAPYGYWPFIFLPSQETYGFVHWKAKETENARNDYDKWSSCCFFFWKWQICATNANVLYLITIWLTKNAHLQFAVAHQWIIRARLNSLASYTFSSFTSLHKKETKTKCTFAHGAAKRCELLLDAMPGHAKRRQ